MTQEIQVTRVILDEADADKLLRILYNGTRPACVHTLACACGAFADLRKSPGAWDGWQLIPHPMCPRCLSIERVTIVYLPWPEMSREKFFKLLEGGDLNRIAE